MKSVVAVLALIAHTSQAGMFDPALVAPVEVVERVVVYTDADFHGLFKHLE